MIGRLDPNSKNVTIIGAGYAGLLCAYRLLQKGYTVTIYEQSDRPGGLIATHPTPYGIAETAAHSIRSSPEILALFSELKLPYIQAKTKKKFILRDGSLRKNPLTLWDMFTAGCYAAFKKSDGSHLTLAEWTQQHVGPGAVNNAIAPLAHGIYAAEPEELDQQLAFPRMTIPEGQTLVDKVFKNKTKADKSFVMAPANGMIDLIASLTNFIETHEKGKIVFNRPVHTLPDDKNIILATPAFITGKLIGSERLANIRYAPMITVTVFVQSSDIKIPESIGFLNARGEDHKILGVLFNSTTFESRSHSGYQSLTVMMGGTSNFSVLDASDEDIKATILSELSRILGFKGELLSCHITRWPNAIPLYSAELRETLAEIATGWCAQTGHVLFGNYTGEVSIRGMCQSSLALTAE